ncbi:MAG: DUF4258 domain-containing protein [Dehalococcoidia bacterium]
MTFHAVEEMAEDGFDIVDVETALRGGGVVREEGDDPRGPRFTTHGPAADGLTPVGVVGRFTETDRLLIITVCEVTEKP